MAFSTTNSTGISLKTVLESRSIPKVFFDIRNDSASIHSHHHISVNGIVDVQLLELATRTHSQEYLPGLATCIERDSTVSYATKLDWRRIKDHGSRLYDPMKVGRYEIFNERPIKSELILYCANDVELLPGLFEIYRANFVLQGKRFGDIW